MLMSFFWETQKKSGQTCIHVKEIPRTFSDASNVGCRRRFVGFGPVDANVRVSIAQLVRQRPTLVAAWYGVGRRHRQSLGIQKLLLQNLEIAAKIM